MNLIEKQLELLQLPPVFDVEVTPKCNMNCIMCPRKNILRQESMSIDLMQKSIDWFPKNSRVMLAGLGEPLLNKNISFFIAELNKKNITTGITTNGLLLTSNVIKELSDSGLNMLQISFNGSNKEVYNSIMKDGDFDTVMNNIAYLSKHKPQNMIVNLAVTKQRNNISDIENICELARKYDFGIFIRNCHSRAGFMENVKNMNDVGLQHKSQQGCGIFSQITFIAGNGDILSCCQDLTGKTKLGSVLMHNFSEIVEYKRQIISENKWSSICNKCDDDYRYHLLSNPL